MSTCLPFPVTPANTQILFCFILNNKVSTAESETQNKERRVKTFKKKKMGRDSTDWLGLDWGEMGQVTQKKK